ncbi:MAG: TIGR04190 family B12-binding domain/radical SAM domain protein [Steroidobacteraceae bacterium]|jgi:B12-binding domain/radical SAM domain protein|nr:TIGR04190 family B12-binding domain/radical SAM domain protein [Steroidobacteraceae bacterium]
MDLLLLHPPSVYDFREKSILYGPVSDMVPSSVVFEIYPIGFLTIAGYLQQQGLQVRIVNLALRMLTDRRFDVPAFLAAQNPRAIGIDLHWMPHCHGAIEIARIAKQVHPGVPVIFGGLSSTYFHRQLLEEYPEIDFVLRGDSTEPPLHQLLSALREGGPLDGIPNLTWRKDGEVRVNQMAFIPQTLDYVDVRPELLIEMAVRYRDFASVLPFNGWLRNPTTMVLPLKGCAHECVTCGSSAITCTHLTLRRRPVFRSPASLAGNLAAIGRFSRGPIIIPGDLLQGGKDYACAVIDEIAAAGVTNPVCFEFFDVPPIGFLKHIDARLPNWSFEISPESHDHPVRRAMEGETGYDNEAFEAFLREALDLGCRRMDVFFMIGLPGQTYESVMQTVDYCEHLFGWSDARLQCFISPMGPFLDPGSRIFEDPARFGYRKFAHTVEEHRQLLVQPSWEQILNYETEWMTRAQLVDATYDAAERLNALKLRYGRISARTARGVADGIAEARRLRARLAASERGELDPADAERLRGEIARFSQSTVCDKRELFWQRHLMSFRLPAIARVAAGALRG